MEVVIATGDAGGFGFVLIGVAFYAFVALKDYLSDVRYYRARKLVREREQ